jgi:hypothetical protein
MGHKMLVAKVEPPPLQLLQRLFYSSGWHCRVNVGSQINGQGGTCQARIVGRGNTHRAPSHRQLARYAK